MCKIEGICQECANTESCPMLAAHREFQGTLRSINCMDYRPVDHTIVPAAGIAASAV